MNTFFEFGRSQCLRALPQHLAVVAACLLFAPYASAQQEPPAAEAQTYAMPPVEPGEFNGDVRDLPQITFKVPHYYHLWNEFEEPHRIKPPVAGSSQSVDAISAVIAAGPMPAPSVNFAGIGFGDAVTGGQGGAGWPPDTNGDVGPTVYIQAVNDTFGIFNKSNGVRLAAFTEDSLWSTAGTGTPCHGNNQGDPVVLHDGLADRWILTNFGFAFDGGGNPVAPFYQCIAVSKTSDPVAGGWWFYAVQMDTGGAGKPPANTFNDYGKFGLWTDCLYMGANGFNNATGSYAGAIFAAFNRTTLFAGQALSGTNSSIGYISSSPPFSLFPANLLGTSAGSLPPAGTPEYFVDESGSAFDWEVRKFVQGPNVCGAGSSLSAATNVTQASYGYPATEDASDPSGFTVNIVGQKSTTNKLDSLGDRVMQKVQYRKIGSAESLWVTHTTCGSAQDASGVCATSTTTTSPQWAQINVTNKTIATTPVQQQIYRPDTTLYRWMGALAVDVQGNMAMGYSTSSTTAFPGIAYSGRLVGDALNTLPQTETQLVAGVGSQNLCGSTACERWGDYSSMSIDPSDDCTFWYTSEYYATVAHATNGHWDTQIGAFKFPGCTSIGPASKLVFTVQPNASYASGATITVKVSIEDAGGNVVTTDTSAVTLALGGGTVGAVLSGTKTVNAVAGVATFSTLAVDKVGTSYVLNATDGSLTGSASTAFNITVGAAKTVTFTTGPAANANIAAGVTIPLVAHVVDAGGNSVSAQSIALSILNNPGASTLSVTTNPVTTDASGNATFVAVSLNKVGTAYTLKATDNTTPAATPATSNAFNIVAGVAKTVTFTTQPATNSSVAAGAVIPLVAHVVDVGGNAVANESITLGFTNNAGGSTLSVTTNPVVTNASGDATFANVSLNKVGTNYTLKATDNTTPAATPATSNAFNIIAGAAKTVTFTTQPTTNSNIAAGAAIPLVAHVADVSGNPVANESITLGLSNNAGGSALSVTTNPVTTNAGGLAAFANVSLNKVGAGYTLSATDTTTLAATPATSNAFNIVAGAPATISFTQQPGTTSVNTAIAPALVVNMKDGSGNVVPGDNVTLTIGANPGAATLAGGNSTATDASGNATFGAVSLDKVGVGYTLVAADSSAVPLTTTSNTFNIVPGAPALAFTTQPTNVVAGNTLTTIAVTEEDATGQPITTDNLSMVDFTVSACGGSVDLGSAQMVNGVATLSAPPQRFYSVTPAPGVQVSATATTATLGTLNGTSQYFAVVANGGLVFADSFDGCRL
jgi:hypothetical protein